VLSVVLRPLSQLGPGLLPIPLPDGIEVGVIAAAWDGKVRPDETHLAAEADHVIADSGEAERPPGRRTGLRSMSNADRSEATLVVPEICTET
jgi:hypothetical protein